MTYYLACAYDLMHCRADYFLANLVFALSSASRQPAYCPWVYIWV